MNMESAIARQEKAKAVANSSLGRIAEKDNTRRTETRSKRRKERRDVAECALLESITRIKAQRRAGPKDWERGYNSAITQIELFLEEIKSKQWVRTEM